MTNGDRIRASTDEQIACTRVIGRSFCSVPVCEEYAGDCKKCVLAWLKKEEDQTENEC